MKTAQQIELEIAERLGIINNTLDGVPVQYAVKPMRTKTGVNRYQINVPTTRHQRDRIFRTTVKDMTYDVQSVEEAIKQQVRLTKVQYEREQARSANAEAARKIREEYDMMWASSYAIPSSSFIAAGAAPNTVQVQIYFGAVSIEDARKIAEFANSIRGK